MNAAARQHEREGRLSRFSLDRRITVLVLFLSSLVVGAIATTRIPIELMPDGFDRPFLMVSVPWADAPAREVLDKVVLPLEEELNTVRGIDNVISVSRVGRGSAYLFFKHGTDMDVAYREVRDRVERARIRFPSDIDRVYVRKDDASGIPVFVLGVALPPELTDTYNLVQNEIVLPLERIDGVASVQANGILEKEVLIELDRDKVASAGLNIYEMAQDLAGDNFTMASGSVRDGSRKLLLRSIARYDSLEAIENRRVAPSIRLGDVATVSYEEPERKFRVRAMSKPAVAIVVLKEGDANIREVSYAVSEAVEKLKDNPRLGAMDSITLFSQGEVIDEALRTLLGSGAIGGLIAAIVLFLFLRRFRLMVIIALGIPVSLLIGLTVMYFSAETLNLLTLIGLMLCVGLLVDNSVVVAENIHRLHKSGLCRRDACVKGAGEVGLAITMSTLTTIVVFLPVALVDGPGQFFLMRLAMPVCVSVAASLVVALVFIPLCVYLTLGAESNAPPAQRGAIAALVQRRYEGLRRALQRFYDATFGTLNTLYCRVLAFFAARRLDLVLLLLAVFAVTIAVPMQQVTFVDVQDEERSGFAFEIEMAANSTLEETEDWFLQAEAVVEGLKDELGLDGWFLAHRKQFGEFQGWMAQPRTTDLSVKEITERVLDALPERPGMTISVGGDRDTQEDEFEEQVFTVTLNGEDPDQLDDVGEQLEQLLLRVDGVLGLTGTDDETPNELGLVIDREKAQRLGVNPQAIAGIVGYALRGTPLPKYRQDGKEIPVRVRYREEDRESLTELADFMVPAANGESVALSSLTEAQFLPTPRRIVRRDSRISRSIVLELEKDDAKKTRERLSMLVAGIDLPEGVGLGANRAVDSFNDDLMGMAIAGVLSIVFIYLLMGFLFESFVLPFSIVLTIPLSIIGIYWIHMLAGMDIDFLGVVAGIVLVGVVVNNGIVLIDYVNRLRQEGHSRTDALLTATARRFRPIMMTAITTIGGMIPLAFAGQNSIGLSYTSFSLTLIGGMTTATLLTLLVVPVFYTLFDDLRESMIGLFRRLLTLFGTLRSRLGRMAPLRPPA